MKGMFLVAVAAVMTGAVCGQDKEDRPSPFFFPVCYRGDVVSNLAGGYARGTEYLGYGTVGIGLDTEKACMWKGGEFYVEGATTHGGSPSLDYIGDLQIASNIEAGEHVYMQKFHFRQKLGGLHAEVGLLDLNEDFANCTSALLFHNSSFGIHSVISYNFSAPIFPVTGLGALVGWNISEKWHVAAGAYDGAPIYFDEGNPYNVRWELSASKGYLTTAEVCFTTGRGTYKLNGYYHTADERFGTSVSVDQNVLKNILHSLNIFFYGAFGHCDDANVYSSINGGVKLDGVLSKRMKDSLGIGCAASLMLEGFTETALEFVYSYRLGKFFCIEPDFQYIINPFCHGADVRRNAVVASLRFIVEL